jgi:hypothetical protein
MGDFHFKNTIKNLENCAYYSKKYFISTPKTLAFFANAPNLKYLLSKAT